MQPSEPIFVVAAPCAGSGALVKLLRAADGVQALDAAQRMAVLQAIERDGEGNAGVDAGVDVPAHADARSTDARLQAIFAGPHRIVSAAAHHALTIPQLRTAFPLARFIYLHRDPAAQMAQAMYGSDAGAPSGEATAPSSTSETRGWAARARRFDGQAHGAADSVDVQNLALDELVALRWSFYTSTILNDLALLPPDVRCAVRYDDLVEEPTHLCTKLGMFADLRFSPNPLVMSAYRQQLKCEAHVATFTPAPWTTALAKHAEDFTREAHLMLPHGAAGASADAASAATLQRRELARNHARRGALFAKRFDERESPQAPAHERKQAPGMGRRELRGTLG